jgi:hypothetical protein
MKYQLMNSLLFLFCDIGYPSAIPFEWKLIRWWNLIRTNGKHKFLSLPPSAFRIWYVGFFSQQVSSVRPISEPPMMFEKTRIGIPVWLARRRAGTRRAAMGTNVWNECWWWIVYLSWKNVSVSGLRPDMGIGVRRPDCVGRLWKVSATSKPSHEWKWIGAFKSEILQRIRIPEVIIGEFQNGTTRIAEDQSYHISSHWGNPSGTRPAWDWQPRYSCFVNTHRVS